MPFFDYVKHVDGVLGSLAKVCLLASTTFLPLIAYSFRPRSPSFRHLVNVGAVFSSRHLVKFDAAYQFIIIKPLLEDPICSVIRLSFLTSNPRSNWTSTPAFKTTTAPLLQASGVVAGVFWEVVRVTFILSTVDV